MFVRSMDSTRAYCSRLLLVAALLLAVASACGLLSSTGFIAYTVGEPGSRDVVVSKPDGSDRRILTDDETGQSADDFAPVWSPDRQRIAFLSNRDGNVEIYLAVADGSSFTRVTNTSVDESHVRWSPEGTRLAYISPTEDGAPAVFWLSLSNLLPNRLLFSDHGEADPVWSPQGTWIAFAVLEENGDSIGLNLRNPEGVNRVQLSQSPDRAPAWSPDGKKIAFVSTRDGDEEVYVVEVGETGPAGATAQVTDNPDRDFAPEWSPDGKRIAFLSDRNGNVDIFTSSGDGKDLETLTRTDVDEISVIWGPDGRVIFESAASGKSDIYLMDAGGVQQQLTTGTLPSTLPDW